MSAEGSSSVLRGKMYTAALCSGIHQSVLLLTEQRATDDLVGSYLLY
jgi:hypothetical protein